MPQMMPINWFISLFFFIFIFILFNIMNYFIFNIKYTPKNDLLTHKKKFFNWKW